MTTDQFVAALKALIAAYEAGAYVVPPVAPQPDEHRAYGHFG